jgi:lipopolysaccharide transport system permease protein
LFFYQLNPMSAIVQGFRWAMLGSGAAPGASFWVANLVIVLLLTSGAYVFRRTERTVVDIL